MLANSKGRLSPLVGGYLARTCMGPGVPGAVHQGSGRHQRSLSTACGFPGPHHGPGIEPAFTPLSCILDPDPGQVSGLLCQLPQLPTRPGTRDLHRLHIPLSPGTRLPQGVIHFPLSPQTQGLPCPPQIGFVDSLVCILKLLLLT